jgi:Flp pilus assembly CpaF family ATPase
MCTIHADSSAGAFRRIASYAAQASERIPLEASNLLTAGAIHFVVHLDSELQGGYGLVSDAVDTPEAFDARPSNNDGALHEFPAVSTRQRFISSIREVVDAEGVHVVSNEIFRSGIDRRAVAAAPLRPETLSELERCGYQMHIHDVLGAPT